MKLHGQPSLLFCRFREPPSSGTIQSSVYYLSLKHCIAYFKVNSCFCFVILTCVRNFDSCIEISYSTCNLSCKPMWTFCALLQPIFEAFLSKSSFKDEFLNHDRRLGLITKGYFRFLFARRAPRQWGVQSAEAGCGLRVQSGYRAIGASG